MVDKGRAGVCPCIPGWQALLSAQTSNLEGQGASVQLCILSLQEADVVCGLQTPGFSLTLYPTPRMRTSGWL